MCQHRLLKTRLCLFVATIVAVVYTAGVGETQELKEEQTIKDEAWAQEQSIDFIRTWLLCGVFPNPPREGELVYDHTPPCVGLETDYLTAHGGETTISPVAGMAHRRPDGTEAKWFEYASTSDIIDFNAAFAGQPTTNVVAYAYTTIKSEKEGKVVLSLGSDDGVRIWLNGKLIHDNLLARGITKDEDTVPVTLQKEDNRLLVKVEQGRGGWGFALRILGKTEYIALKAQKRLRAKLTEFQNCELRPKGRWDYMFTPGKFPEIVWKKPHAVEKLMGSFPIEVRWFNDKLEEVSKADKPGRYLVYVEGQRRRE